MCVHVPDLRWVQVNSSEEAYRVMKIGKKNQSFSATRLNQLSSRRSETLVSCLKCSSVLHFDLYNSYTQFNRQIEPFLSSTDVKIKQTTKFYSDG